MDYFYGPIENSVDVGWNNDNAAEFEDYDNDWDRRALEPRSVDPCEVQYVDTVRNFNFTANTWLCTGPFNLIPEGVTNNSARIGNTCTMLSMHIMVNYWLEGFIGVPPTDFATVDGYRDCCRLVMFYCRNGTDGTPNAGDIMKTTGTGVPTSFMNNAFRNTRS